MVRHGTGPPVKNRATDGGTSAAHEAIVHVMKNCPRQSNYIQIT